MAHTEQSKDKMRSAWKSRREKGPVSEQTRKKMSESHKGRALSEEHKKNISESKKFQKLIDSYCPIYISYEKEKEDMINREVPTYVDLYDYEPITTKKEPKRHLTEEHKQKIRESVIKSCNPDVNFRKGSGNRGKTYSNYQRQRISEGLKKYWLEKRSGVKND